jgi:sulfur-oxidizing protein SoxY
MPTIPVLPRRRAAVLAAVTLGVMSRKVSAQPAPADDPWPSLAAQIFNDHKLEDGHAVLSIEAPYRAEDAAVVPISVGDLEPAGEVRAITLVIDQNPSPLAATFTLGPNSGIRTVSTRIRVDSYTNIHAVAATGDGRLYSTQRYVKAAGGCSAPAAKQEVDAIPLGTMRLRQFTSGQEAPQAELMIRHPNYSGMQMDQLTRLYVPAHFVSTVRIWQGDDLLLGIESGISISENPAFRFDYRPNGASEFRAEVQDSQGKVFKQSWPAIHA